ncbi:uncharacterized protein METZ01_LOCUS307337, partial [marine metagenome]
MGLGIQYPLDLDCGVDDRTVSFNV